MMNTSRTVEQRIQECQGLVRFLATQIHRRMPPFIELDDLMSYGQLGLAQAARDYKPDQGTKFSTFAYYRIRGAIYDGATRMQWFRQSRQRTKYDRMANEVLQVESSEAGDDVDLAREASWFRRVTGSLAVVHLATRSADGEEETDQDLAGDSRESPLALALQHEAAQKLGELIETLPADCCQLIRSVYFDGLTLQEAGERLGISKGWASRLHARALEHLARGLRTLGIDNES